MRVSDVMTGDVVTIAADCIASAALDRMRDHRIHHLVVLGGKDVIGMISDRDLLARRPDAVVREVMATDMITIPPAATLRRAAALMHDHGVGALAVVRRGGLEGIVTASDLIRTLAKGAPHPAPPAERVTLRKRGPRKRARVI